MKETKELKKESELEKIGKLWFKKLEEGDSKARDLWQWSLDLSLREFNKIYELICIGLEIHTSMKIDFEIWPDIDDIIFAGLFQDPPQ